MIRVTKFDGSPMVLNADWIQSIEKTPDTLITLTNGTKLLVRDMVEDLVKAFVDYKKQSHPIFSMGSDLQGENS